MTRSAETTGWPELWRGSVNAWECDELGHFNVRFYLAKMAEAVGNLAELSGLSPVLRADVAATLIPRDIHIRFLAEAHPGAPLFIEGGFLDMRDCEADAIFVMRHAGSGKPAASFRVTLSHTDPTTGHDFAWPQRFTDRAGALCVDRPDFAAPRGIDPATPPGEASLAKADRMALEAIGRGRFTHAEMDAFGRLRAEFLLGRVSDSVTNFTTAFPEEAEVHARGGGRIGSVLLECRIRPLRWPRTGDGFVIRSGLRSAGPKVRNLVHWVLEPATGKPWWTMEGVAAPMDLDARKLIVIDAETQAKVAAATRPDLAP